MASMLHCFRTLCLHMIVARETLVNSPKTRDMKFGGLQTPRIGFFIRGGPYSCLEILDRKTGSLQLEKKVTNGGLSKLWSLFGPPKLGPVLGPVL